MLLIIGIHKHTHTYIKNLEGLATQTWDPSGDLILQTRATYVAVVLVGHKFQNRFFLLLLLLFRPCTDPVLTVTRDMIGEDVVLLVLLPEAGASNNLATSKCARV